MKPKSPEMKDDRLETKDAKLFWLTDVCLKII